MNPLLDVPVVSLPILWCRSTRGRRAAHAFVLRDEPNFHGVRDQDLALCETITAQQTAPILAAELTSNGQPYSTVCNYCQQRERRSRTTDTR